jgi:HK97 gp10 family phage protein
MGFEIKLTDNFDKILSELTKTKQAALEAVGQQVESYAKANVKASGLIDTGRLINSITHVSKTHAGTSRRYKTDKNGVIIADRDVQITTDDEDTVTVGTAVSYAPYHEYGTGIYAEGGTGRKTAWRYMTFNRQTGKYEAVWTRGTKPKHFLRNAIVNHQDQIKQIVEQYLRGNA